MTNKGVVALWVVLAAVWTLFVVSVTATHVAPSYGGYVCPQEDEPGWDWRVCGNGRRGE
jgi:hypothetical protein